MFCRKCGSQLDDNAKFCVSCGASVDDSSSNTNNVQMQYQYTVTPGVQSVQSTTIYSKPKKQKSNGAAVLALFAFIIIVISVSIAVVIVTLSSGSGSSGGGGGSSRSYDTASDSKDDKDDDDRDDRDKYKDDKDRDEKSDDDYDSDKDKIDKADATVIRLSDKSTDELNKAIMNNLKSGEFGDNKIVQFITSDNGMFIPITDLAIRVREYTVSVFWSAKVLGMDTVTYFSVYYDREGDYLYPDKWEMVLVIDEQSFSNEMKKEYSDYDFDEIEKAINSGKYDKVDEIFSDIWAAGYDEVPDEYKWMVDILTSGELIRLFDTNNKTAVSVEEFENMLNSSTYKTESMDDIEVKYEKVK